MVDEQPALPPTTTTEQDRKTSGQRHINVMWERTQQVIAIWVVVVTTTVCGYMVVYGDEGMRTAAFLLIGNIFILVVNTYFQRTNHTKSSGSNEHR